MGIAQSAIISAPPRANVINRAPRPLVILPEKIDFAVALSMAYDYIGSSATYRCVRRKY
jgi:hypothetical protein